MSKACEWGTSQMVREKIDIPLVTTPLIFIPRGRTYTHRHLVMDYVYNSARSVRSVMERGLQKDTT
jgi:hypothetical protein